MKPGFVRAKSDVLRTEMLIRGWGQKELSEASGRPLSTINNAVNGRNIRWGTLVAIHNAFKKYPADHQGIQELVEA